MSNKIFLKTLLLGTLLIGGTSFALSGLEQSNSSLQTVTREAVQIRNAAEAPTIENSTELSSDDLGVLITRSTVTPSSQAYDVTFSSEVRAYTFGDRTVFIKVNDPNFTGEEEPQKDENLRPVYEGQVYRIEDLKETTGDVVIPNRLAVGTKFFIDISSIGPKAVADEQQADKLKSILVPSGIKDIDDSAFDLLEGKDVKVNVMAEKDDPTISFDKNVFHQPDKNITWGYKPTSKETKLLNSKFKAPFKSYGNGKDYVIGYKGDGKYDLPLTVAYFVNDETTPRTIELPITSSTINDYDCVGAISGFTTFNKTIDIPLEEGEVVDDDRIYFLNIYQLAQDDDGKIYPLLEREPDTEHGEVGPQNGRYFSHAIKSYILKDRIDNYINYEFDKVSTFNGFTSINGHIDVVPGIYQKMKRSSYESNKAGLEDGSLIIRTRFTSLPQARLIIKYENSDGGIEKTTYDLAKAGLKSEHYNLPGTENNDINFLLENKMVLDDGSFNSNMIRGVELENFYITLDLFAPLEQRIVSKSSFTTRFGIMELVPDSEIVGTYDLNAVSGIIAGVYSLLFLIISVSYFMYAKNKYKNDEFKRVNPKAFTKTAILAYLGLGIVIFAIAFIGFRFWPLNNSIVVYNPTDPLVVGFSVAALLVIGYYIKTFVTMFKANLEKRKTDKLKLNEDVDNDGTK